MDDDPSGAADGRDDDEEEDYEDTGGGSRLLGFMFGNVDDSGDLDVDYLDEDAKEHLAALADKLGPSLTDIDLSKSSPAPGDTSEQDYDEKAEDAIDYEDIDEQYDGPEIQSEEDHLLPKKDYYSSDTLLASLGKKESVFDEENYDEDEETIKESEALKNNIEVKSSPAGVHLEIGSIHATSPDGNLSLASSPEPDDMAFEMEDFEEESNIEQEQVDARNETTLPVLCVEDGMVILKFSEIFGIHEPLRKTERKDQHKQSTNKERVKALDDFEVEEDEEAFLRSSYHDQSFTKFSGPVISEEDIDIQEEIDGVTEQVKDSCLCAQPMKDVSTLDVSACHWSPLSPKFYPLDQQDWENAIVWGNSPTASHGCSESCVISELDAEANTDVELENEHALKNIELGDKNNNVFIDPVLVEPFNSRKYSESARHLFGQNFHPQLLRLESLREKNDLCSTEMDTKTQTEDRGDIFRRFNKLSLQNKDLLDGSWLDQVIWDPDVAIPKPKLILDLQDEQMLFEVFDHKESEHLRFHSGAMVMMHSSNSHAGDSFDLHNQGMSSAGRFNISNDKYYSNRKTFQQAKSHAKKRSFHGIKVMHSVPALKLQTMKPKLSNKDIANFHRPRAFWYPHDNVVIVKAQGMICTSGPIKVIITSLGGGKGIKLHVDAEETLSAVKSRASKKLDFKLSEKVKVFYFGKELEDDKSLALQNVRPNSVLHLVRTTVHLWPKAQKLPGENKPLRPPGAFKKKSDLSVKDGHVFLMEYCEERPLLLGNVGMGARLCTYYQKTAPSDQTALSLRNVSDGLGTVLSLESSDKSPFLGDIGPGCSQSCLETNMYRAPIFPHKASSTDYLLVRSAKGMLSLRRIDKLYSVGQQEPHIEVLSPGSKSIQTYLVNRMLVYVYREFRANEKPDVLPCIRYDDLAAQFPGLTDAILRKRIKHCADLRRGKNGVLVWAKRRDFRIPLEDELRRMLTPESVCSYESMLTGLYRLKRLGISRLTHPVGLSAAMNQLPDEAIALAAASHIERELQITPWNLTSNFVACTSQDRENIERLEITGVGDPSGRGLGFSFVRVTPKAHISNAVMKKKAASVKVGSAVTGTDADLRRLSMGAAQEVLLKFNVPAEQINRLTRWHRIALVRKLSSEQAASGVEVDAMTLGKFARGQRMSFLQLQQQTREKCQEIWDRQVHSLSAADGDEIDSDSEANSDLDSFAGDLENLLDAEEFEEEEDGNTDTKCDKADVVRGLKMRRVPSQAQTEEEIEDDEAEAAFLQRLLDDDEAEIKKKKKKKPASNEIGHKAQMGLENADSLKKINSTIRHNIRRPHLDGSISLKESLMHDSKEVEKFLIEKNLSGKIKTKSVNEKNDGIIIGVLNKKSASAKDGMKVFKEKKQVDRPCRDSFVCGACGQHGHMRTNKNCPKYGEDLETLELETVSAKPFHPDATSLQLRTPSKKLIPKVLVKLIEPEVAESAERAGLKSSSKVIPLKIKYSSSDKIPEKNLPSMKAFDMQTIISAEAESKPTKISKLIISNKMKSEDVQYGTLKPSVVIRAPVDVEKDQTCKKIVIKQPKAMTDMGQASETSDIGTGYEFRKTKKIMELSSFDKQKKQESHWFNEEDIRGKALYERRMRDEEERRRSKQGVVEERMWRMPEESMLEQKFTGTSMYGDIMWTEEKKSKKKKKKKKKPDFRDEYLLEHKPYRNDRRIPERDRASKRRHIIDSGQLEYAPPTKRRRGAEVVLSNILESIVESLKESYDISYLFLKPVTKKDAPDYHHFVKRPMDLSTVRDKVRNMEYTTREEFRHDVWQITYNAHMYNDGRNPLIPPLADQLLELCDYHLREKEDILTEAESGIDRYM